MNRSVLALLLVLLISIPALAADGGAAHITGAWVPPKIGPVAGGMIYAFDVKAGPPPSRGGARRLADAIATTDAAGKFSIELPGGSYYISAWKRTSEVPGPPQDGDLHGLSRDEKGAPAVYTVKAGQTLDIGTMRQGTIFRSSTPDVPADATAISGTLRAPDGSPLSGAVVEVYTNPAITGKPVYVSPQSGTDGKYLIRVDREGTYYVAVRAGYAGGRPRSGDMYGLYGGENAKPVQVRAHTVTSGIDIQVGAFVDNRPQ